MSFFLFCIFHVRLICAFASCFLSFVLSCIVFFFFFFSSRRRHTRYWRDWSSDVCSSDLFASVRSAWQRFALRRSVPGRGARASTAPCRSAFAPRYLATQYGFSRTNKIGRASCRERV